VSWGCDPAIWQWLPGCPHNTCNLQKFPRHMKSGNSLHIPREKLILMILCRLRYGFLGCDTMQSGTHTGIVQIILLLHAPNLSSSMRAETAESLLKFIYQTKHCHIPQVHNFNIHWLQWSAHAKNWTNW
jgi:hypothetical protein